MVRPIHHEANLSACNPPRLIGIASSATRIRLTGDIDLPGPATAAIRGKRATTLLHRRRGSHHVATAASRGLRPEADAKQWRSGRSDLLIRHSVPRLLAATSAAPGASTAVEKVCPERDPLEPGRRTSRDDYDFLPFTARLLLSHPSLAARRDRAARRPWRDPPAQRARPGLAGTPARCRCRVAWLPDVLGGRDDGDAVGPP